MTTLLTQVFELPAAGGGGPPDELHVLPIGRWWDARNNDFVDITPDLARDIFETTKTLTTDLMVDWRHRSLTPVGDSQDPAADGRAAAWLRRDGLQLRSDGIYATNVAWTKAGGADVAGGNYRYLSPVIAWDARHPVTGRRANLLLQPALTNSPLLDGIKPIIRLAAEFLHASESQTGKEKSMKTLIPWLRERGRTIADDADESAISAELTAYEADLQGAMPAAVVKALAGKGGMTVAEAETAIENLRAAVPTDVAKALGLPSVTVAEVTTALLKNATVAETVQLDHATIAETVRQQIADENLLATKAADGSVPPKLVGQYRALLIASDPAVRNQTRLLLAELQPTGPAAPPLGVDTKAPAGGVTVTAAELRVAEQMGVTEDQLKKQKEADAAAGA